MEKTFFNPQNTEAQMSHETFKQVIGLDNRPNIVTKYDPKTGVWRNFPFMHDLQISVDMFVKKDDPARFVPCAESAKLKHQLRQEAPALARSGKLVFSIYALSDAVRRLDAASLAAEAKKNEASFRKACLDQQKAEEKSYFEHRRQYRHHLEVEKIVPVWNPTPDFEDSLEYYALSPTSYEIQP